MKPKVLVPYDKEQVATVQAILGDSALVVSSERTAESMLEIGGDAMVVASGRVPADFIDITRLGLVEITRKREGESLADLLENAEFDA